MEKQRKVQKSSLSRVNPKLKDKPIFIRIPILEENQEKYQEKQYQEKQQQQDDIDKGFGDKPAPNQKPTSIKTKTKKFTNKQVKSILDNMKKERSQTIPNKLKNSITTTTTTTTESEKNDKNKIDNDTDCQKKKKRHLFAPVFIPKEVYSQEELDKLVASPKTPICSQVQPILNNAFSNDCPNSSSFRYNLEYCKNISCWWCCHTFDTYPVPIPISYNSKTKNFKVYGVTCSFNCAKSYIKSNGGNGGKNYTDKIYLLSLLHARMTGKKIEYIKEAPSNKILKMFGGHLSIEEYRENFNTNQIYKVLSTPFIPTMVQMVSYPSYYTNTMNCESSIKNNQGGFILPNPNNTNEKEENQEQLPKKKYRLQRTKPLPTQKNTLKRFL